MKSELCTSSDELTELLIVDALANECEPDVELDEDSDEPTSMPSMVSSAKSDRIGLIRSSSTPLLEPDVSPYSTDLASLLALLFLSLPSAELLDALAPKLLLACVASDADPLALCGLSTSRPNC